MTQEEFDKAPLLDQILYDETGMLVKNHKDIAEAMEKYHQAKLKAINYILRYEQLTVKKWEIDFGGDVLAGLEITNNEPRIIGAMNRWGNGIDKEAIIIKQRQSIVYSV